MQSLREINEYLFYEFAVDLEEDPARIADDWPFRLESVGSFRSPYGERRVYRFDSDGVPYYVIAGKHLGFYRAGGMSLDDLRRVELGSAWIGDRDPIMLDLVKIGDDTIPPTRERRAAIQALAAQATGSSDDVRIVVGVYLRRERGYVALIEVPATGRTLIVGTHLEAQEAPFLGAVVDRRLAAGIGAMLEGGALAD